MPLSEVKLINFYFIQEKKLWKKKKQQKHFAWKYRYRLIFLSHLKTFFSFIVVVVNVSFLERRSGWKWITLIKSQENILIITHFQICIRIALNRKCHFSLKLPPPSKNLHSILFRIKLKLMLLFYIVYIEVNTYEAKCEVTKAELSIKIEAISKLSSCYKRECWRNAVVG